MMTQTEVNRLFEQVNKAFETDRHRLDELEKRLKALEPIISNLTAQEASKKPAKSTEK